jgi:hypothetical protein
MSIGGWLRRRSTGIPYTEMVSKIKEWNDAAGFVLKNRTDS